MTNDEKMIEIAKITAEEILTTTNKQLMVLESLLVYLYTEKAGVSPEQYLYLHDFFERKIELTMAKRKEKKENGKQ